MFITVAKCFSVAVLLAATIFDPAGANRLLLEFIVFSGSIVVVVQAARMQEHIWTLGFIVVALLFNPLIEVSFSLFALRWLDIFAVVGFLASVFILKSAPFPSPQSITDHGRFS
jgi:uncharacterized protein DUF6804